MTRILVLNGNTTQAVTDRIAEAARAAAPEGVTVEAMTAPYGLPLIVTRADWLLSGPPILEALAARRGTYDAAVIAVFGDPALDAAKLLLDVPVIGISEAAFHAAAMLGRRFGIVSFTAALRPMFEDCLDHHGLRVALRRLPHGPARCLLPRPARRGGDGGAAGADRPVDRARRGGGGDPGRRAAGRAGRAAAALGRGAAGRWHRRGGAAWPRPWPGCPAPRVPAGPGLLTGYGAEVTSLYGA